MTPIRLTDIQRVLLAHAAQQDSDSLLPPCSSLGDDPARVRKAVAQLIRRGLAAEADLPAGADIWRDDNEHGVGVIITEAGRAAIDGEGEEKLPSDKGVSGGEVAGSASPAAASMLTSRPSKTAEVLALLRRPEGATLDELVAATGWLPHTTRAALTGLRKKGHGIVRDKRGDATCYTLAAEEAIA